MRRTEDEQTRQAIHTMSEAMGAAEPTSLHYESPTGIRISMFARGSAQISDTEYDIICRLLDLAKVGLKKHVNVFTESEAPRP